MAKQKQNIQQPKSQNHKKTVIIALISVLILLFILIFMHKNKVRFGFESMFKKTDYTMFGLKSTCEVELCEDLNVENWYAYHRCASVLCTVYAGTTPELNGQLRKRISDNENEVTDAIRTVIGNADLNDLRDPELSTIKTQLHSRINEIVGDGLVDEILVPQWHIEQGRDSRYPANQPAAWRRSEY